MEEQIIKAVASLVQPFGSETAKRIFKSDGKASDALTTALTKNLANVLKDADPSKIAKRMLARTDQISIRKQFNFENVASLAIQLASERPEENRRPIDEDWFLRWFEAAEQVSETTIQMLWARAFDQQTDKTRKRLSLRALDSLRLMEREDALNFRRAVDIFEHFGVITVTSLRILQGIMGGHALDSLIDQGLVTLEEYRLNNIAVPGGLSVYFRLPEGIWAPDPLRQYRLTARARELASTIPDSIVFDEITEEMFDISDSLLTARYINLFADGLDNRYEVMLAIHPYEGKRPPPGGIKRTHQWDHGERHWIKMLEPSCPVDPSVMAAFEDGYGL